MNSHKGEPLKITGEIPVSLNLLSVVNGLAVSYMKLKGSFYILIGLTWLFIQSPSRQASLAWSDHVTPIVVGALWIATGLVSVYSAYWGSHRLKRVGFFALIITPTLLGFYFLISWIIYLIPFIEVEGYQRAGASTAVYWAYSVSAYVMSRIYVSSSGGIEGTPKGVRP